MTLRNRRIAFFTPSASKYSETFIQAHIDGIHGDKDVFHQGEIARMMNGETIPYPSAWSVMFHRLFRRKKIGKEQLALYSKLKSGDYGLAFIEYGTTAARIYRILRELEIPIVVHFHGFDISTRSILAKNESDYREIFAFAKKVIVVSREMEHRALSMGCSSEKIIYSPCGAHSRFSLIENTPSVGRFVFVGRFVEKKGPLYTLMAFNILLNRGHRAVLDLVGEGPLFRICKDYARAHQIEKFVNFHGVKKAEEVVNIFSSASCYVQHSITSDSGDQEGTPVAIMEAMLAGLPIISTSHAGIKDIVRGEFGKLVDEGDVLAMADCMEESILNPKRFSEMGANGRQFILNNHTLEHHLLQLNQAIAAL